MSAEVATTTVEATLPDITTTTEEAKTDLEILKGNTDAFFLIILGMIIFFMQAGFAFLEAGSVRLVHTSSPVPYIRHTCWGRAKERQETCLSSLLIVRWPDT